MKCNKCGNNGGFYVNVTDYKPLEMWEFSEGSMTRYCQKDAGDNEMDVVCASCGSDDVDFEGFDKENYTDRPLVILSDDEWDGKVAENKTEEAAEENEESKEE
jgi:hypothetical protein